MMADFRLMPREGDEAIGVRAVLAGLVESRRLARAEQEGDRVADAAAAVHLERQVEPPLLRRREERDDIARVATPLRQPRIAGEGQKIVQVHREALDDGARPRQADQRDGRSRQGSAQGPERRDRCRACRPTPAGRAGSRPAAAVACRAGAIVPGAVRSSRCSPSASTSDSAPQAHVLLYAISHRIARRQVRCVVGFDRRISDPLCTASHPSPVARGSHPIARSPLSDTFRVPNSTVRPRHSECRNMNAGI